MISRKTSRTPWRFLPRFYIVELKSRKAKLKWQMAICSFLQLTDKIIKGRVSHFKWNFEYSSHSYIMVYRTHTARFQWRIQVRPMETPVDDFTILSTLFRIRCKRGTNASHWILTSTRVVFTIGNQLGRIDDTITRSEWRVLKIH